MPTRAKSQRRQAKSPGASVTGGTIDDAKVREIFERIDTDHSGTLDQDEVALYFSVLGWKTSPARRRASQLIAAADVNDDQQLDFEEFLRICRACEVDGTTIPQPPWWKSFAESAFGSTLATSVAENVASMRVVKDSVDASLEPFQTFVRQRSIESGAAKIVNRKHGLRKAPVTIHLLSWTLECCMCLPLLSLVILLLCWPVLYGFTDDVYRFGKSVTCTQVLPVAETWLRDGQWENVLPDKIHTDFYQDFHCVDPCPKFYDLLNVHPHNVTARVVKRAARHAHREYHPDRACSPQRLRERMDKAPAGASPESVEEDCLEENERLFQCVTDASETLQDLERRKYYDEYNEAFDYVEHLMFKNMFIWLYASAVCLTVVLLTILRFQSFCLKGQSLGHYVIGVAVVNGKTGRRAGCCDMVMHHLLRELAITVCACGYFLWHTKINEGVGLFMFMPFMLYVAGAYLGGEQKTNDGMKVSKVELVLDSWYPLVFVRNGWTTEMAMEYHKHVRDAKNKADAQVVVVN